MEIFHVCWKSTGSGPLQGTVYRIVDSNNNVLYMRRESGILSNNTNYAVNLTTGTTSKNFFTIQALSPETVPSATFSFNVSG